MPPRKVTINMAPADVPKTGTQFDLPVALAILTVTKQLLPSDAAGIMFAGELALDGSLRPIKGALHLAELARANNLHTIIVPEANANQARMIAGVRVVGLASLQAVFLYLKGDRSTTITIDDNMSTVYAGQYPTIDDVYGQSQAKRALAVAAAGHHNLLLAGSPGTGKSMLAKVLTHLLPSMQNDEIIATTKIHSLSTQRYDAIMSTRPFRSPHHSASRSAILGGGSEPSPGEISLAHNGVLFLDELPEYPRTVLESLRQPLEDREVTITRMNGSIRLPANFMLVATMNPCPCGYHGDPTHECLCTPSAIAAYNHRLSGPLLDRIDLIVNVPRVPHESFMHSTPRDESTSPEHNDLVKAIATARAAQRTRYGTSTTNAALSPKQIARHIRLPADAQNMLLLAAKRLDLSARAYFKVIRVARSIADLDGCADVTAAHVSEALQYRMPAGLG